MKYKQFFVSKCLWGEVVFRFYNSQTPGIFSIAKTVTNFCKRFCFPNLTVDKNSTIKNCLKFLQLKNTPSKNLQNRLQPVSKLTCFPCETLQSNNVGPLSSPVQRYVLTAFDVLTEYLLAVSLRIFRANTIALELTVIFFRHQTSPQTIVSELGTLLLINYFMAQRRY